MYVCMYWGVNKYAMPIWRADNLMESVIPFYHVSPKDYTQVISVHAKNLSSSAALLSTSMVCVCAATKGENTILLCIYGNFIHSCITFPSEV